MAMLNLLIAKWYLFFVFLYVIPGGYCSVYWTYRPIVSFTYGTSSISDQTFVGIYADYSNYQASVFDSQLELATDNAFGCTSIGIESSNITRPLSFSPRPFVIMMPLSYQDCSDYLKADNAQVFGAAGVVFYYLSGSADNRFHSPSRPRINIPVAAIEISEETLRVIQQQLETSNVSIRGDHYSNLQTSQTFYFVVFSFCILTILSCLWFVLSYVRKCRTASQRRQRRAQAASETLRLVNNLPLKTYKSRQGVEEPTCAICLEMFSNKDTIRVLPCNHEFHKRCIDPWLKLKRNCPMCKEDISTQKGKLANQTRAVSQTRPPRVSTRDSGLQLLFNSSSDSEHTTSSEIVSAINPVFVDYQRENEEENNTHTVVVFDKSREEDQQNVSESPIEYPQLVREDSPGRQVAIGMEAEGKDQLPTLNTPA